ncbi:periplasmic heavy metal sensor [Yoonia sp.]|uniref:periplasmic heavy metal sensor n=1 Tax=Yoonia sp. TaxID=2212373 RepID=UPI002E05C2FC|nr:periplasmic heavy metal sensor [Yoonia sp.]
MAEDKSPQARPSRLWQIVLVLSLALNLAVVGVVVGSAASGRWGDGPPRSFDLGLAPIARALEPQERRAIGRKLREDRSLRDFDLRDRVNRVVTALRADPFDPDVLRALLAEQSERITAVQATAQEVVVEQIIAMTPERRRAFAEQVLEEMARARSLRDRSSGG